MVTQTVLNVFLVASRRKFDNVWTLETELNLLSALKFDFVSMWARPVYPGKHVVYPYQGFTALDKQLSKGTATSLSFTPFFFIVTITIIYEILLALPKIGNTFTYNAGMCIE